MTDEQQKNKEAVNWEEKAQEYLNGWKRAMADYANREKEIGKEKAALRGLIEEMTVLEFLPVLDNLKLAQKTVGDRDSYGKGVEQVVKQFEEILKKFGAERIDVLGKDFDPALCEAAEKQGEGNKIIEIVLDGYKKGDRVIRPARVIVG